MSKTIFRLTAGFYPPLFFIFIVLTFLIPLASAGFGLDEQNDGFGLGGKVDSGTKFYNATYYNISNYYGLNGTNGTDGVNGTNGVNGTAFWNMTNGFLHQDNLSAHVGIGVNNPGMSDLYIRADNDDNTYVSISSGAANGNATFLFKELDVVRSWLYYNTKLATLNILSINLDKNIFTIFMNTGLVKITTNLSVDDQVWASNLCYSNGSNCNTTIHSTYNSTYDSWAYNQTTPAIDFYNINPNAYYNSSSPPPGGAGSSYNITYHHTSLAWLGNYTDSSKWWYNMTTPAIEWCAANPMGFYNSTSPAPTYNSTYATWAYNQTTLTKIYKSDATTTNISGIAAWGTLYTMPLAANTNYTINCYMVHSSNVTTSGIRYNVSLAAAPDWMIVSEKASTTATASQYSVVSGASISLMPIAVTASLVIPAFLPDELNIFIDGNANTGGNAQLQFSGELANLLAVVGRGSYCEVNVAT